MFSNIGPKLVRESNDWIRDGEKRMRNRNIGLALDLILGIGLILAAVYVKPPLAGTYALIALGGLELGTVALDVITRLTEKTARCCKALTQPPQAEYEYGVYVTRAEEEYE